MFVYTTSIRYMSTTQFPDFMSCDAEVTGEAWGKIGSEESKTLAELLNYDGDLDRSYRYIRFTWQCNSFFNTRLRATQISPVLNVIEKNYQDAIDRNTRFLIIGTVVGTLLALLLFVLFYTVLRQKRRLAQAQADLRQKNEELEATNHKLQWMNERVVKNNKQLFEINHRLQEEKNGNM